MNNTEEGWLVLNLMCSLCLHTALVVMPASLEGKEVECAGCGKMQVPVVVGEPEDFERSQS